MSSYKHSANFANSANSNTKRRQYNYTIASHIPDSKMPKVKLMTKFVRKFPELCREAGITNAHHIDQLMTRFFNIKSIVAKIPPPVKEDVEEEETEDSIMDRMANIDKTPNTEKKTDVEDDLTISPAIITTAGLIVIKMINYQMIHKNTIKDVLDEKLVENIKSFNTAMINFPAYFEFPANAKIHPMFEAKMHNLDVLPQKINLTEESFANYFDLHIEAIAKFDVDINSLAIEGCCDPRECSIVLNQNKILAFTEKDEPFYKVAFLSACSDVALGQFPKEVKYLPKFINNILKKLPTISSCFMAVQDIMNVKPLAELISTKDGDYLTGGKITPSSDYISYVLELSSRILEAVHTTAINRNSSSPDNYYMNGKKRTVYPVVFSKYHMTIGHVFADDARKFSDIVSGIKDIRYVNISMEMAMMATLVIAGVATEPLGWVQDALSDYYKNINRVDGESQYEKKERITVANSALFEMIKYLDTILNFKASRNVLNNDEFNLINSWICNAMELFPKTNPHKDEDKDKKYKVAAATFTNKDEYYGDEMNFPPAKPIVRNTETPSVAKVTSVWGTQISRSVTA